MSTRYFFIDSVGLSYWSLSQGTAIRERIQESLRSQQSRDWKNLLQNGKEDDVGEEGDEYYYDDDDTDDGEEYYDDDEYEEDDEQGKKDEKDEKDEKGKKENMS